MNLWCSGTEIVIWGTGLIGQKTFYQLKGRYKILYFVDNENHKSGEELLGIPVYSADDVIKKKCKIIIASGAWREIAEQLMLAVKTPLTDFVPFWLIDSNAVSFYDLLDIDKSGKTLKTYIEYLHATGKRIMVIHGNCQTSIVEMYLNSIADFRQRFFILRIPKVCQYENSLLSAYTWKVLWESCDILITQNINETNRFNKELSVSRIITLLRKGTEIVRIPNIYFNGYFPSCKRNVSNVMTNFHPGGLFPFRYSYIDELFYEGMETDKIISVIKSKDFIPDKIIRENIEISLNEYIEREKDTDIRISDAIIANYKRKQLFYSFNHPVNELLKLETFRILQYLGGGGKTQEEWYIEKEAVFDIDINHSLRGQDAIVYPSVIAYMDIKEYETVYYPNRCIDDRVYTLEEYVREYIRVCLN